MPPNKVNPTKSFILDRLRYPRHINWRLQLAGEYEVCVNMRKVALISETDY